MDNHTKIDKEIQHYLKNTTEMNCDYRQTAEISRHIAEIVNKYITRTVPNYDKIKLSELRLKGFTQLDNLSLSHDKVQEIHDHFRSIPVFAGHVPAHSDGTRRFLDCNAAQHPFGSYEFEDSMLCPYLLELALSSEVLSIVEGYLGCAPTIYSINTWWSFPGFPPTVSQDFHRDVDDFKFLALFVYLTDVEGGKDGGQHRFITYTQHADQVEELLMGDKELAQNLFLPKLKENGYNNAALYESRFREQITDITGKAGSVFIADTFAFHKGVPPIAKPRLVCWVRYGLRKNLAYADNARSPMPFTKIKNRIEPNIKNKYMLRLFTTDKPVGMPVYKVETDNGIRNITLENFDWKFTNKKYHLKAKNFTKKIMQKITGLFRETVS